jgi:DNA-binding XRE family transcriptional regulator
MKKTTVTDTKGNQFVLLPKGEYDRLLEKIQDAADLRLLRDRADDGGDKISGEMMQRLLSEHPIKVWREHRKLSQESLAKKIGVTAMYVSHLETGHKKGSLATLKKIAATLKVDLDDLV